MVLRQGMAPVLAGTATGLVLALVASRWMSSLLFEIAPSDPWALVLATLTLLLCALAASAIPALRATRVDPATALRTD
jgi:ABC-type antimicrobial peptide transport system permease subunit